MADSGKGRMALIVMWTSTAITLVFVVIRLFTRHFIVHQLGADDAAYFVAGLFLLLYTAFVQVALPYGFGESMDDLEHDNAVQAIKWEMIGQTFAALGMSIAKLSMGLFLLRLVVNKWHRIAIWSMMLSLFGCSCLIAVVFWVQCIPVQAIFDPLLRPMARCEVPVTPFGVLLGVWCIVADFFFAIFPPIVIWGLQMKRKEKILVASSMSIGVLAGIAGIFRTYEVAVGFTTNYTRDTVALIVWSAVEMAVTMICNGIPIIRPLYRRIVRGYGQQSSDAPYYKHGEGGNSAGYELDNTMRFGKDRSKLTGNVSRLGMPFQTVTDIQTSNQNNNSDENILNPCHMHAIEAGHGGQSRSGIHVTDDIRVEWNDK